MELIEVLQQIIQANTEAQKPTDIAYGTVTSTDPLTVTLIGTMQPIPAEALELSASVSAKTMSAYVSGSTLYIKNNMMVTGDKVLMLRVEKGQKYIILSKVI